MPSLALSFGDFRTRCVRRVDQTTGAVVPLVPHRELARLVVAVDAGTYGDTSCTGRNRPARAPRQPPGCSITPWPIRTIAASGSPGLPATTKTKRDHFSRGREDHRPGSLARSMSPSIVTRSCTRSAVRDQKTGGRFVLDHRILKLPRDLKGTTVCSLRIWSETKSGASPITASPNP